MIAFGVSEKARGDFLFGVFRVEFFQKKNPSAVRAEEWGYSLAVVMSLYALANSCVSIAWLKH